MTVMISEYNSTDESRKAVSSVSQNKYDKKVQVGKDQEKAQSEKDSHSKNRDGKKTKLTIRYLYHENTPQAEWAAIFPIGGHSVT